MKYTKGLLVIVAMALLAVVITSVLLFCALDEQRTANAAAHPTVECVK